jgi:hypothetical protein
MANSECTRESGQLKTYLRDCYSVQWGTNESLVQEVCQVCEELQWSAYDLSKAHDEAKRAMQHLRMLTESYACRLKYLNEYSAQQKTMDIDESDKN